MMQRRHALLGLGAAALGSTAPLWAQPAWPSKPVKFVVAFAPGGPADIIARVLGQKLGEVLGQSVVVENRAGAGGSIASGVVAKAEPDGYTLLINTSSYAVNPAMSRTQTFDAEKDLVLASLVASSPNLIVAAPNLKAKTLKDVIADAHNGKYNYGTAGAGTTPQLSAEYLFKVLGKVNVTHVPFQGAGPALNAAMGGRRRWNWSRPARCAAWRSPATSGWQRFPMCPRWPSRAFRALRTTPGSACLRRPKHPSP
jgi:tripartite-type tricarboxylate transporter receptor subunit TctC